MKHTFTLASLAMAASASRPLVSRQTDDTEAYIQSVCFPATTDPVPPCQAIINIESACQPNGTSALSYQAHQQCMCNGGYFPNWLGCLNCQYVHGTRSEAVAEAFEAIISSASASFCSTATPTAVFAEYFSAVSDSAPQTAAGAATSVSDQFPSQSAVSLYYTASGAQGPGVITGSAAEATATAGADAASSETSLAAGAATTAVSSSRSAAGSSSSSSSSSSSMKTSSTRAGTSSTAAASSASGSASASASGAAQTGAANAVIVSEGLLAVVAGAMMLM